MNGIVNHFQQKDFWWASHIFRKLGYKDLERAGIREELSEANKWLSKKRG